VSDVSIAPDRVHVGVGLALSRGAAQRLGLDDRDAGHRAQLATQGITGVKFVDIDVVATTAPSPALPFTPGAHYIPSIPSLLTGLQNNIETVVRDLPRLVDRGAAALESLRTVLDDIHDDGVSSRVATLAIHLDEATTDMRRWIAGLQRARLPENAASVLASLQQVGGKLELVLDDLRGTDELVASAKRATDALGDLGRGARGSAKELDRTLREVAESARAIRELAELLERDPDALVRGRSPPRSR
jgi:paraquat-inducible protein B